VRTWFHDVGEILPLGGGEHLIHILFRSCFHEEVSFEPLGMAESFHEEVLLNAEFQKLSVFVLKSNMLM